MSAPKPARISDDLIRDSSMTLDEYRDHCGECGGTHEPMDPVDCLRARVADLRAEIDTWVSISAKGDQKHADLIRLLTAARPEVHRLHDEGYGCAYCTRDDPDGTPRCYLLDDLTAALEAAPKPRCWICSVEIHDFRKAWGCPDNRACAELSFCSLECGERHDEQSHDKDGF